MSLAAEALGFTEVPIRTNDLLVESVDGVICPEITFQVPDVPRVVPPFNWTRY